MTRRIIAYYSPRIQIPTETMQSDIGKYALYCLPVDGAQALSRIAPYLKREVTYINEIIDNRVFYGPTEQEFSDIHDLIDDLEVSLMSPCDFSSIVDAIQAQTETLNAMMQCICSMPELLRRSNSELPDIGGYVDNNDVTYLSPNETMGQFIPPATDVEKCELAQSIWYYTYQVFTEKILPFASSTSDSLTATIVAATAFGAIAGFVGIPVAILAAIVVSVVAWGVSGSIDNFINWMLGTKDEIICVLYNNLPDVAQASSAVGAFIDGATEISYLDRQVLKTVLASSWHYTWVMKDQQENGTWDDYFVSGQCDECVLPDPECVTLTCDASDWSNIPPADVGCHNGHPYISSGAFIRWNSDAPTQTSSSFRLEVTWTGFGDSGNATMGIKLISRDTLTDIFVEPNAVLPVGETATSTWDITFPSTVGQELLIQTSQVGWHAAIHSYCIRPL